MSKIELYAIALVVLLAVAGGLYAYGHHEGYREREDKDAQAALEQEKKSVAKEAADRQLIESQRTAYEAHLDDLHTQLANRPASVVRVCHANAGSLPATSTATGGTQSANPAQLGNANGSDNPVDIGPALDRYKEDVQALALRCDAILKAWPR